MIKERRMAPQRVSSHPICEILKNNCRTDLIGGVATQTFAPGGKHPRAATTFKTIVRTRL